MLTADVRDSDVPAIGRSTTWQAELVLADLPALEAAERAIEESMEAIVNLFVSKHQFDNK